MPKAAGDGGAAGCTAAFLQSGGGDESVGLHVCSSIHLLNGRRSGTFWWIDVDSKNVNFIGKSSFLLFAKHC